MTAVYCQARQEACDKCTLTGCALAAPAKVAKVKTQTATPMNQSNSDGSEHCDSESLTVFEMLFSWLVIFAGCGIVAAVAGYVWQRFLAG